MLEFIFQGGKTMIPLVVCSLVSLTIIIERFIAMRKKKIIPSEICSAIIRNDSHQAVVETAYKHPSALSRVIKAIYDARDEGAQERSHAFLTSFKKEVVGLEQGTTVLEVIASITPLLGLLGTVIGMVDVFTVVAEVGVGQASALSYGISKALITTIAGLSIAIPTLVFHSFFMRQAERYALVLEEHGQTFFQRIGK